MSKAHIFNSSMSSMAMLMLFSTLGLFTAVFWLVCSNFRLLKSNSTECLSETQCVMNLWLTSLTIYYSDKP